jgi:hypothetical protein
MEIRSHVYLLSNYSQTYLLIGSLPTLPNQKNNPCNTFSFPTVEVFVVAVHMDKPKTNDISKYF